MAPTSTPPYVPPIPPPPPLPGVHVQPPMVYIPAIWEYQHLATEPGADEQELNSLGARGWELVGIVPLASATHFYFKRLRR